MQVYNYIWIEESESLKAKMEWLKMDNLEIKLRKVTQFIFSNMRKNDETLYRFFLSNRFCLVAYTVYMNLMIHKTSWFKLSYNYLRWFQLKSFLQLFKRMQSKI